MILCLSLVTVFLCPVSGADMSTVRENGLLRVKEGRTARLVCPIDSSVGVGVMVWMKGERVLFAGSLRVRQDTRLSVYEEEGRSVLVVAEVEEEDGGSYQCQVEEVDSTGMRWGEVEVEVHTQPTATILQVGDVVSVREGVSLALTCRGDGIPLPTVYWYRENTLLSQGRGEVGLLLQSLTRSDQGILLCTANNGVGDQSEDTLQLDILYPPTVDLLPPSLSFSSSCSLELQCLVQSSSYPTIHWYRDNHSLLLPSSQVTLWSLDSLHVLQIHVCDLSLVAEYSCTASSSLGQSSSSITVSREDLERELARREEQEQEEIYNTVRRHSQERAMPLVSSSHGNYNLSFPIVYILSILIFFCH